MDDLYEKGFQAKKIIKISRKEKIIDYKKALDELIGNPEKIIILITPKITTNLESIAHLIATHPLKSKIIPIFLGEKSKHEYNEIFKKNKVKYINRIL